MLERWKKEFEGRRVTVMGLGLLGRGVGDAQFLAEAGAEVLVTDLKTREELQESVERLSQYPNVTFILGEHRMEDFENRDFILKAAGVPKDSPYIAHARERNIPIEMSASLFVRLAGIPIIGVTGTRGKSTVTHMVHHVLSQMTEGGSVLLGGNVRGVSTLALLNEVKEESLAVLELDSWQLQGCGEAKISPQIAVFTNFMADHLNYYKGDMDAYFEDKAQIFLYQEEGDVLVTTPEVFERIQGFVKDQLEQQVLLTDTSVLPEDALLSMPGEHNRLNAALAYQALKATSLSDEEIFEGLASFPGVPGRLQFLREIDGVRIYNDNNATTPAATLAALRALGEGKNIILVMGGADKDVPREELVAEIDTYAKRVLFIPGTGTDLISKEIEGVHAQNLKDALSQAREVAQEGDVILFSPGFASFGAYANEYERGDEFVSLVNSL
ncbi:UDP-N-acetylmuramoyl-L-alanine--D-glutamate ligase [Candidatus Kaiserbacteria bacterium]|nr:UDP-N-acetylmuramoyl-L-alanine--D-glutamate ligase [Candidatus Kaiserbacteria bacterium]